MSDLISYEEKAKSNLYKFLCLSVYVLFGLFYFHWGFAIAGLVINFFIRDELRGTYFSSHSDWQRETFWITFGCLLVGYVMSATLVFIPAIQVGFIILSIWVVYRLLYGVLNLLLSKKMPYFMVQNLGYSSASNRPYDHPHF